MTEADAPTQLAEIENVWGSLHVCFFCRPELYPRMPAEHTLCARCGALISTPGRDDPRNLALSVCPPCDAQIEAEIEAGADQ